MTEQSFANWSGRLNHVDNNILVLRWLGTRPYRVLASGQLDQLIARIRIAFVVLSVNFVLLAFLLCRAMSRVTAG